MAATPVQAGSKGAGQPAGLRESVGTPAPGGQAPPRELVQTLAFWILVLVLVWLGVSMAMVLWLLRRRHSLDREQDDDRRRRRDELARSERVDAWAEAGRRAQAASTTDLRESSDGATSPAMQRRMGEDGARPLAIVTGGARRVGRATCMELARAGFDILVTYRHSAAEAGALVAEIKALGVEAIAEQLDTSDEHAVEAFGRAMAEQGRVVDALVLNASSYEPTPLEQLDADTLLRDFRVNALAGVLLTARLAPCLRASKREGGGAVVVMCDIHAMGRPRLGFASYNITKAAACESVATLARELAPEVRVCGVAPGAVAWPEQGHESQEADQKRYLRRVPLGRVGTPEDAASAVRWLVVEATYVTGQIVRIDGGRWIT